LVRQVTSKVGRLANDAAALDATFERFLISALDYYFESLNLAFLFFCCAVLVWIEQSHDGAADHSLRDFFNVAISARHDVDRFRVLAAQNTRRGSEIGRASCRERG